MRAFPKIDNFIFSEKGMYFTDVNYNCFGLVKKGFGITDKCFSFDGESMKKPYLFSDLVSVDDCIYAVPLSASHMYKIKADCENMEAFRISYSKVSDDAVCNRVKFMSAHVYDKKIYMMPALYPAIVVYDTQSGLMSYIDDWVDSIENIGRENERAYFRRTRLIGDVIYAPLCRTNRVLKYFIKEDRWELAVVSEGDQGYSDICFDGTDFWLSSRMGNYVTCWNEQTGQCRKIDGVWSDSTYFSQIEYYDGKVWVLPKEGNNIGVVRDESISAFLSIQANKLYSMRLFEDSMYVSADSGCVYEIQGKDVNMHFVRFDQGLIDLKEYAYSDIYTYFSGSRSENLFSENVDNSLEMLIEAIIQN